MTEAQPKNRGGRPQKFPGEGPRITHATRLRAALAEKIADAAFQNHRSLGEEIEHRLDLSFHSEEGINPPVTSDPNDKLAEMSSKIQHLEEKREREEFHYRLLLANERISVLSIRKLVLKNSLGFNSTLVNIVMLKTRKSVVLEKSRINEQIADIDRRLELERIEVKICHEWIEDKISKSRIEREELTADNDFLKELIEYKSQDKPPS